MGHADDRAGELGQHLADHRGGQGGEVPGGLVQHQHVGPVQHHGQKQQLGPLSPRQPRRRVLHLLRLVLHAAQQRAGPGDVVLVPGGGQQLHRGLVLQQQLVVILGHIGRPDILPGQQRLRRQLQQGGLARPVGPHDAEMLWAVHPQADAPGQRPSARRQLRQIQPQHRLACGQGGFGPVEGGEDGLLPLRQGGHVLFFPFIASPDGQYRVHFRFHQCGVFRILPGGSSQRMIHLVSDLTVFGHFCAVLRPFLPGHLLLVGEARRPLLHILGVSRPGHGTPGGGAPPQPLQMDDHVGGVLQQGLVVGDIEHRNLTAQQKALQPPQRGHVQVVGRLVQQQHVRLVQQEQGQP